jgi:hypothetical protein
MGWNPANWAVTNYFQGQPNPPKQKQISNDYNELNTAANIANATLGNNDYVRQDINARANAAPPPAPANNGGIDQSGVYTGTGGNYDPYAAQRAAQAAEEARNKADDLAYLNDQENSLRGLFGEADNAFRQGQQGIADEFGRAEQRKKEDQARANRDYNLKETTTTTAKTSSLGKVNDNARNLANSVRRRLALSGGTSSSAYQEAAPAAVAAEATRDRTGVMENYGANFNAIKTARDDAKSQFERMFEDLRLQRSGREQALQQGVLQNKNDVEQKLSALAQERAKLLGGGYQAQRVAQQPYLDALNSRKGEINSLADRYRNPFTPQEVKVANPSLRDYMVENAGITPEQQQEVTYNDYLNKLKKQDEEQF